FEKDFNLIFLFYLMGSESISYSAPGKVILFGEHAVVYGYPAIVMAIDLRAKCKISNAKHPTISLSIHDINPEDKYILDMKKGGFVSEKSHKSSLENKSLFYITTELMKRSSERNFLDINIHSPIPIGAGLGSSAAVSVATIASISGFLGFKLSLEEINQLAFEAEKINHGKPSGIDNTISTYGGIQLFKSNKIKRLNQSVGLSNLVIFNSLRTRNTKKYVMKVLRFKEKNPDKCNEILESIGTLTEKAHTYLEKNDVYNLGELMSLNHSLLEELGVGHPLLTKLVQLAEKHHALGSKLTGAGGGGSLISLFENKKDAQLAIKTAQKTGFQAFLTRTSHTGVKKE
ncbi:MAG: mevalonate kinase, partial [Candidatus Heimdallarchaeaceae archaeon]